MPSKAIVRSKSKAIAAKRPGKNSPPGRKAALPKSGSALGALPEWNLADLYTGLDDPAIKRDLDRIDSECLAFEEAFKGRLAELAQSPEAGSALAEAV
jgi:oligoendopeptidase F